MAASRTARELAREQITADIIDEGRTQLAEHGAAGLSLRSVARELGMVSSAVYRYVASRDDLLTRLIIEAYDSLGDAVELAAGQSADEPPLERWVSTAHAVRDWALARPQEYFLVFGTPVPGYAAPEITATTGTRTPRALVGIVADALDAGQVRPPAEVPQRAAAGGDKGRHPRGGHGRGHGDGSARRWIEGRQGEQQQAAKKERSSRRPKRREAAGGQEGEKQQAAKVHAATVTQRGAGAAVSSRSVPKRANGRRAGTHHGRVRRAKQDWPPPLTARFFWRIRPRWINSVVTASHPRVCLFPEEMAVGSELRSLVFLDCSCAGGGGRVAYRGTTTPSRSKEHKKLGGAQHREDAAGADGEGPSPHASDAPRSRATSCAARAGRASS